MRSSPPSFLGHAGYTDPAVFGPAMEGASVQVCQGGVCWSGMKQMGGKSREVKEEEEVRGCQVRAAASARAVRIRRAKGERRRRAKRSVFRHCSLSIYIYYHRSALSVRQKRDCCCRIASQREIPNSCIFLAMPMPEPSVDHSTLLPVGRAWDCWPPIAPWS